MKTECQRRRERKNAANESNKKRKETKRIELKRSKRAKYIQTANKRYMKLKGRAIDKIVVSQRGSTVHGKLGKMIETHCRGHVNGRTIESERTNKGKISVRTDDNNVLR